MHRPSETETDTAVLGDDSDTGRQISGPGRICRVSRTQQLRQPMSKTLLVASLLLATALIVARADDDGDVLVLDADNFDREVDTY